MERPRKYKIGEKVNNWEIIDFSHGKYLCRCKCGLILERICSNLKDAKSCQTCYSLLRKNNLKYKIGDAVNDWTILDVNLGGGKIFCKCKCGFIIKKQFNELKYTKSCKSCYYKTLIKHYPGEKLNTGFGDAIILERLGNYWFKIQCFCGKIYKSHLEKSQKGLNKGKFRSCGCVNRKIKLLKAEKKIGLKLFYLKIIGIDTFHKNHLYLKMQCKCGKEFIEKNGNEFGTKSCGCFQEHIRKGENHHFARFKNKDIISIREMYDGGQYSKKDLSKMLDIKVSYLEKILKKELWDHI